MRLFTSTLAIAMTMSTPAMADCIDDAARYQQVHPYVLRAIAYHESRMRADLLIDGAVVWSTEASGCLRW